MHTLAELKAGSLKGIKRLQLSEKLTEFPMEILTLAESLEILDLSNNQLTDLPNEINKLTKLKIIFASNNLFTVLPEALGTCASLEMVGFKSNQIVTISEHTLPPKLRWLILTDNKIVKLPDELGERPRLKKLALAGNQLTTLPQSMSKLHELALLRISANQLTEFPIQLLALPKLAWFAFAGNPFCQNKLLIKSIPEVTSNDYHLLDILGQGASGVIYQADWVGSINKEGIFPEEIAVKVFKGEVTSDGYPQDELQACLKVGSHHNLVSSIAQVNEKNCLALVMKLIPTDFKNLGLPPSLQTCTRDTFDNGFSLSINAIGKIVHQMQEVFEYLHLNNVCHGDLYAHNTLFDQHSNIIFGDFGAASMYHMLPESIQSKIKEIEHRALLHFIDDLLTICKVEDQKSDAYLNLKAKISA